jgi:hypothetical protein
MLQQKRHGPYIKTRTLREYDAHTQINWDCIKLDHLEPPVKVKIQMRFWETGNGKFISIQGQS